MKLHTLKPAAGSTKTNKRLGRGQGSNRGGTSTKGHKGAQSRSGYSRKVGFEGGQMPLQRRLPKFGFNNIHRVEYKPINLQDIQKMVDTFKVTIIDLEALQAHGLIGKHDRVKILANGALTSTIEVKAHAFSKTAIEAIEKAGGKYEIVK
jgi:large subunit ribosomal protein L15